MNCETFRGWIYLTGDDELSAEESRELSEHLAGCAECSALASEMRRVAEWVASIREKAPVLRRPDELVDSVLSEIRQSAASAPARSAREVRRTLLDRLLSPGARCASAAIAGAMLLLFAFQAGTTLSSLSKLEGKMALQPGAGRGPAVVYRVSTAVVRTDPDLRPLLDRVTAEYGLQLNGSLLIARGVLAGFAGGGTPGPFELAHVASMIGSEPERLRFALRAVERRVTTEVFF